MEFEKASRLYRRALKSAVNPSRFIDVPSQFPKSARRPTI
jgi:hypothetical protein